MASAQFEPCCIKTYYRLLQQYLKSRLKSESWSLKAPKAMEIETGRSSHPPEPLQPEHVDSQQQASTVDKPQVMVDYQTKGLRAYYHSLSPEDGVQNDAEALRNIHGWLRACNLRPQLTVNGGHVLVDTSTKRSEPRENEDGNQLDSAVSQAL